MVSGGSFEIEIGSRADPARPGFDGTTKLVVLAAGRAGVPLCGAGPPLAHVFHLGRAEAPALFGDSSSLHEARAEIVRSARSCCVTVSDAMARRWGVCVYCCLSCCRCA